MAHFVLEIRWRLHIGDAKTSLISNTNDVADRTVWTHHPQIYNLTKTHLCIETPTWSDTWDNIQKARAHYMCTSRPTWSSVSIQLSGTHNCKCKELVCAWIVSDMLSISTSVITHWGWYKMAAIFHTFSNDFFFNKNVRIWIKISLKFVPKGPINIIPALV